MFKHCYGSKIKTGSLTDTFRTKEEEATQQKNAYRIRKALYPIFHKKVIQAGYQVQKALKDGRLKKSFCVICGNKETVAHHYDYDKPLSIIWLCRRHHFQWHRDPANQRTIEAQYV